MGTPLPLIWSSVKTQTAVRDPLAVEMYNHMIFQQKLEYVHINPLHARWNLADRPENYYCSSARFYETGIDDFGFLTHYMDRFLIT